MDLASTHISEIHYSKLSKRRDDFATYLVGDVELRQGHVRRAEHGILGGRHDGRSTDKRSECIRRLFRELRGLSVGKGC